MAVDFFQLQQILSVDAKLQEEYRRYVDELITRALISDIDLQERLRALILVGFLGRKLNKISKHFFNELAVIQQNLRALIKFKEKHPEQASVVEEDIEAIKIHVNKLFAQAVKMIEDVFQKRLTKPFEAQDITGGEVIDV